LATGLPQLLKIARSFPLKSWQSLKQQDYMLDLAAAVKREVAVPVVSAGRFFAGAIAEKAIAEDKADLIGLARVL
jgi:2,4-dienoyl-CoA reductase-like NADH-dependent reductase (Old Yellow Enzyme family)